MYANLRVTTAKGKVLYAHRVEIENGSVKVYLDRQDGSGSHAEPGGVVKVGGNITIQADF